MLEKKGIQRDHCRKVVRLFGTIIVLSGCLADSAQGLRLVLCGDSTMARYAGQNAVVGWGEALPRHLGQDVTVFDRAIPGATAESFLADDLDHALVSHADIAVIQFGHNFNDSLHEARSLESLIAAFRREGTSVVLVTPMQSRDNRQLYPALDRGVREASAQNGTPLVALDSLTRLAWSATEPAAMANWFADRIHLTPEGADRVAAMVASALISLEPGLSR